MYNKQKSKSDIIKIKQSLKINNSAILDKLLRSVKFHLVFEHNNLPPPPPFTFHLVTEQQR